VHSGRGLFAGLPQDLLVVRYHSLAATAVPEALDVTARSDDGVVMGVRHRSLPQSGVQFHPESVLTEHGRAIIDNFLAGVS
jgi:anthranilate synthase component II